MQPQPLFSIILPFYRQSDHAEHVIEDFRKKLDATSVSYEIIAVVNGVADLATEIEEKVKNEHPLVLEMKLRGSGWGRAVLHGMQKARGSFICYTNSARTDSDELVRLLQYAQISDTVIVKATRIERSTWMRKWVSIAYNLCNRIILGTPIWDVNATPKIIPKTILAKIMPKSLGDSIDAELMWKAFRRNVPTIEIPIKQTERKGGSSTTNWVSAAKMFVGLFTIRFDS